MNAQEREKPLDSNRTIASKCRLMKSGRIISGVIFALFASALGHVAGLPAPMVKTIAITALTAFWWVTEALPIPATSMVPIALFPMAGILDQRQAAASLGSYVIILLMASFMLSKALEKSGAHERLALYMIKLVGSSGRRLVFGFMLAAAILSMWISNTAATLMLATMALAIIARTDDKRLAVPLLLGIAFAASLGGTATLIGTPPNLIFADNFLQATDQEFSFARWMSIGLPVVAIAIPFMWLWLTRNLGGVDTPTLRDPGPWRTSERRMLIVFSIAILMWVTRLEPFGDGPASWGSNKRAIPPSRCWPSSLCFSCPMEKAARFSIGSLQVISPGGCCCSSQGDLYRHRVSRE